jgi:predicted GH43/DUF377 family glycosyl hydrolase
MSLLTPVVGGVGGELSVRRQAIRLDPDSSRVIPRMLVLPDQRMRNILERVISLPDELLPGLLDSIMRDFGKRHRCLERTFLRHYQVVLENLGMNDDLSEERKLLFGSYITMEYSLESAALFNPSIVPNPNQEGVSNNHLRAIISLRALGEGHISSIEFRNALIDDHNRVILEPMNRFVAPADVFPDRQYDKHLFILKLFDMTVTWESSGLDQALLAVGNSIIDGVMNRLHDTFTINELRQAMIDYRSGIQEMKPDLLEELYSRMILLARSNYELDFPSDPELSERVIFPVSSSEANGIEDARFVAFRDEFGYVTYYATYTAYDGRKVLTQFLETTDFRRFKVHTLNGKFSQSKGMALFPRKVGGLYAMVSRIDGESLYIMYSDNLHFWDSAEKIQLPFYPWELTQIGNCGSPMETERGWLLLTHGVGPMRRYSIGVLLLDLEDPSKVKAQLAEPLLSPDENEREGYVPNVVYSCGSMIHNKEVIIPYAIADTSSRVATIPLSELLQSLG